MVDSSDLTAIATIILAIATFFLAYYTYKSVKSSEKLAKNTQTQTEIILSQQKPQLTAEISYSINDLINLDITNHGPGSAYDVAIECNFFITHFSNYSPNSGMDVSDINIKLSKDVKTFFNGKSDDEIKKMLFNRGFLGRYNPIGYPPIYDKKITKNAHLSIIDRLIQKISKMYNYEKLYPASVILFLKDTHKRSIWMKSNTSGNFSINILFGMSNIPQELFPKSGSAVGYHSQGYTFDELKKVLSQNGIFSIGVYFHLVSRDTQQKVRSHQTIASFIVDFRKHKTLKDAIDENISAPTTLSWKDMTNSTEMIPSVIYYNVKWKDE